MEIFAEKEADRLNLYHLAHLYFHKNAENFEISAKKSQNSIAITLKNGEKSVTKTAPILPEMHLEFARAENAAFGKAFHKAAQIFTDYIPPYGLLFGVRPVKVPLFYFKSGFSDEKTKKILKEEFFVSEEKVELLLGLAKKELGFEADLGKGTAMLYLSIPFCPSRCRYCSFISSAAPDHLKLIPSYLLQMKEEIKKTAALLAKKEKAITAIYMGGGTPGILSAEEMADLLSLVKKEFDLSPLREFCVEMGRPDTVTEEKLSALKTAGVGRISINPQTTSDQTLLRIGRNHTAEEFFRAIKLAKKMEFASINCDLIAGLEGEEPEDFLNSLHEVLSASPEEITLHALCKKKSAEAEPEEKESRIWQDAMAEAHRICINRGLEPYYLYRQKNATADLENTGFAKKGSLGIYNLAMMEDLSDIFACGAGGIGKLLPKEKGEKIRRFPAFKYPFEYLSQPEKAEERLREIERFL